MHRVVLGTASIAVAALLVAGAAVAQVKKLGKGEGAVDTIAWPGYIERGETDKQLRAEERLQGQGEDRRHLGRDGRPDERGRLRPRHSFR